MTQRPIQSVNLETLQSGIAEVLTRLTGLPYTSSLLSIDFEPAGAQQSTNDTTEVRLRLTTIGTNLQRIEDALKEGREENF